MKSSFSGLCGTVAPLDPDGGAHEANGDETHLDYGDADTYADCQTCDDRGTRRLYLSGLGAHTLPCPVCRGDEYKAALVPLWRIRDAADAAQAEADAAEAKAAAEAAADAEEWAPLRRAA